MKEIEFVINHQKNARILCQDPFPLLSIICLSVSCLSVGLSLHPLINPFILTVFNAFMCIYRTHFLFLLLSFLEISIAICLSIQIHTLTQTHTCTKFSISPGSAFMDTANHGLKIYKKKIWKVLKSKTWICCMPATIYIIISILFTSHVAYCIRYYKSRSNS